MNFVHGADWLAAIEARAVTRLCYVAKCFSTKQGAFLKPKLKIKL